MKIIFGLGNPGKKYEGTRHNAGFALIDRIKEAHNFSDFKFEKQFNSEMSDGRIKKDKVILAKPQTFMNLSGEAAQKMVSFYKLTPDDIIVIHDDIDIEIGKYKVATDSSSAGHNGIQNIIEHLGTQKFTRIRVGVKNDELRSPIEPSDFVLSKFSDEEIETIENISTDILKEIDDLIG